MEIIIVTQAGAIYRGITYVCAAPLPRRKYARRGTVRKERNRRATAAPWLQYRQHGRVVDGALWGDHPHDMPQRACQLGRRKISATARRCRQAIRGRAG